MGSMNPGNRICSAGVGKISAAGCPVPIPSGRLYVLSSWEIRGINSDLLLPRRGVLHFSAVTYLKKEGAAR